MSRIREFYEGQNVFITGATGFLGSILLEKLLRDCREIENVFILLRDKKGKSAQERIDNIFAKPAFDPLRSEHSNFAKKVTIVHGDIAQERLGLSATDYERIVDKVSIIFHLAATIRFNEKLDVAAAMNTNSVKYIVDLARACKNLKAAVHVSTAYSHCVREEIKEELYPPPLSYENLNQLIETIGEKKSSDDASDESTKRVLGKWPNTYTFTKAIGESVVAEFAKDLPFAIFRPSIVLNAYKEPMPGWIPDPLGLAGIIFGAGLGVLHVMIVDEDCKMDIVPVDYVCNALVSCAWETAITERGCNEDIPVYNYVSGNENPITARQLFSKINMFAEIYKSNLTVYYPSGFITRSLIIFNIFNYFLHIIPALIADRVAILLGKKPQFYKLMCKVDTGLRAFSYFTVREWNFENRRVQNLWKRLTSDDRRIFPFNISQLDWDEYFIRFLRGIRKYLMGESEKTLGEALRRHFYLRIVHMIVLLSMAAFVLWIIWISLRGLGVNITE